MQPRLIMLLGVAAVTVLLPLAGASAGPVGDGDAKSPLPTPTTDPSNAPSEPRAETTSRCGPELSSPDGIEAQTCVLTLGRDTWARTYYRNATGDELTAVLTLMGPGGRTVQMHCEVEAGDEPAACETPHERTAGGAAAYSAVAEYAAGETGGLLLRSGSNSAPSQGS
ncbi:hypothetical protein [Streptomyces venezuelae]|uniref:Secreted protein n=1 Tax=Streptomyces venezuelae TaxID=54571 RepID=A0A5P2BDU1_STRVZ|nr:hypothetical protein [Streptomyces venezuelae]QES28170.1 hypothetical protein DEJ47_18630 [Streptomyces venezuelae]